MEVPKSHNASNAPETARAESGGPGGSDVSSWPADSARGWLRIQLAVLGFVGFCSVMWAGGTSSAPEWGAVAAAVLVVSAFGLALVATFLVGTVAYALPGPDGVGADGAQRGATRLRTGVMLTYVAVAAVVAATLTAWWPAADDTQAVEVRGSDSSLCGDLLDGPDGAVRLDTDDGVVDVPLTAIVDVAPVADC